MLPHYNEINHEIITLSTDQTVHFILSLAQIRQYADDMRLILEDKQNKEQNSSSH